MKFFKESDGEMVPGKVTCDKPVRIPEEPVSSGITYIQEGANESMIIKR